jgi:hypothetical protein
MKHMSHREAYIKRREKHVRSTRRTKLIVKRWKEEDAKR